MVNNKINSYDEIINLLGIRLDDCDKILRNTIELKEMLNGGDEEDLLIKKIAGKRDNNKEGFRPW